MSFGGRRLRPTYEHPLVAQWAAAGGGWTDETLDQLLGDAGADEVDTAERHIAVVAGGLWASGVRPGDVVAWQRPNGEDAVALHRAAWRLGAIAAPVHHLAGPTDVRALLARLEPTVFVGLDDRVPSGSRVRSGAVDVDPASPAVALATAGSTGPPKLALHSHRALVYKARVMAEAHGLGSDDGVLLAPPLAHISGLLNGVLLTACGLRSVPMAAWEPAEALRMIERERVTFMVGPPTFFVSLMEDPGFDPATVRSLRLVSCGGAGVTSAFVRLASERLGARVKRSYGSTEAPTITTSTADDDRTRDADTDGRPVGLAQVRIVGLASSEDLAPGVVGEVWVRGPELFVGYDDPAATEAAFAEGGWFRTGDLGRLDADGWLTVVGRLRDVIIRGGENIAASDVEAVLEAHPAVRQAVVVGVPDLRLGERVCAFVEADSGFDLAACRSWFAAQGITRFKWPERVEVVAALPLLPAGKLDRAGLRRSVANG